MSSMEWIARALRNTPRRVPSWSLGLISAAVSGLVIAIVAPLPVVGAVLAVLVAAVTQVLLAFVVSLVRGSADRAREIAEAQLQQEHQTNTTASQLYLRQHLK